MRRSLLLGPRIAPTEPVEIDWTHPLAAGLQSYWLLGTDCIDLTLRGLNASSVGGAGPATGPLGPNFAFNGTSQYLTAPAISRGYTSGTIVWRQNPSVAYNAGTIRGVWGSSDTGLTCQVYSDNNWYVGWNASGDQRVVLAASAANWVQGAVSHYALTWGADGTKFYCNGALIGSNASAPNIGGSANQWLIGTYNNGTPTATLFPGALSAHGIFAAEFSAGLIAWAAAEPFAMLRPRAVRRVYAASGGTTSVLLDARSPVAWLTDLERDTRLADEWLSGDARDSTAALAWLSRSQRDSVSPVERTAALRHDAPDALAWIGNLQPDWSAPLAWTESQQYTTAVPSAWTSALQHDTGLPLNWLAALDRDAGLPVLWATGLRADHVLPLAYGAATSLTAHAPLEWLGHAVMLVADGASPIEWVLRPAAVSVNFNLGVTVSVSATKPSPSRSAVQVSFPVS